MKKRTHYFDPEIEPEYLSEEEENEIENMAQLEADSSNKSRLED